MQMTGMGAGVFGLWTSTFEGLLLLDINKPGKDVRIVVYVSVGVIICGEVLAVVGLISATSFLYLVDGLHEGKRCESESSERDAEQPITDTEIQSKTRGDSASIESASTVVDEKAEEVVYKSVV
jgi:hypothetical protein